MVFLIYLRVVDPWYRAHARLERHKVQNQPNLNLRASQEIDLCKRMNTKIMGENRVLQYSAVNRTCGSMVPLKELHLRRGAFN